MIICSPSAYKEFPDYIQEFTLHTLSHRLPGRLRTTLLYRSASDIYRLKALQEAAFLRRPRRDKISVSVLHHLEDASLSKPTVELCPRCAMPATSHIASTNERHSFVSEHYTERRDAPKRIPRPPNAFLLYRSDFLKRRAVPPEVEKRQQNLSRIAGQCWNMLPETEKAIWFNKAAVIRAEHRAKYHFRETGPFHKDTNRLSAKDKKRGSATKSGRSFGRFKTRRMRTPYCEGMFAALHDSKIYSPESQASLIFPTLASESPLSTIASLSPISLPYLLPSFVSHTHSTRQDSPPATSENSLIRRDKFGHLPDPSGSETPQWGLRHIIRDLENTPSEIGSSRKQHPTLQQHQNDFASCVPYPGLGQLPKSRSDAVAQVTLTLPGSSIFSPARYHPADCRSLANDFNVTDDPAPWSPCILGKVTN